MARGRKKGSKYPNGYKNSKKAKAIERTAPAIKTDESFIAAEQIKKEAEACNQIQ